MAVLDFEKTLVDLLEKRKELESLSRTQGKDYTPEIQVLTKNIEKLQKTIFKHLTRWQVVQLSRHPDRPYTLDYIHMMVQNWLELHGDRCYGDDSSMVTGFGLLGEKPICVIGQQKGRSTKEKVFRNFGMPSPEGYRKALRVMRLAERFQIPILCLIDTPGAFPGVDAEDRGQCHAISENLLQMSDLKVPTISLIIGEGGSGGALAIGVTDWVMMLEFSVYSVISPESCAAILWKDGSEGARASELLKLLASDALAHGLIDQVVPEPAGGVHRDPQEMAGRLKTILEERFKTFCAEFQRDPDGFLKRRYEKWRNMGRFESRPETEGASV
jgi:acetyl-CoA carboxylase carboxyl transferase subunit alpha